MTLQKIQQLISVGEAAKLVGVSPDTLRRWAKSGRVRHVVTPSRRILFDPADIESVYRTVDPDRESSMRELNAESAGEPRSRSLSDVPLPGLGRAGR